MPIDNLIEEGDKVMDSRGKPVRHFPFLPRHISQQPPAWLLEFWMRSDDRLGYADIKARMRGFPLPADNTLNMRRERSARKPLGLSCWNEKRTDPTKTELERFEKLTKEQLMFNTTMEVVVTGGRPSHLRARSLNPRAPPQRYSLTIFLDGHTAHVPSNRLLATIRLHERLVSRAQELRLVSWKDLPDSEHPQSWKDRNHTKQKETFAHKREQKKRQSTENVESNKRQKLEEHNSVSSSGNCPSTMQLATPASATTLSNMDGTAAQRPSQILYSNDFHPVETSVDDGYLPLERQPENLPAGMIVLRNGHALTPYPITAGYVQYENFTSTLAGSGYRQPIGMDRTAGEWLYDDDVLTTATLESAPTRDRLATFLSLFEEQASQTATQAVQETAMQRVPDAASNQVQPSPSGLLPAISFVQERIITGQLISEREPTAETQITSSTPELDTSQQTSAFSTRGSSSSISPSTVISPIPSSVANIRRTATKASEGRSSEATGNAAGSNHVEVDDELGLLPHERASEFPEVGEYLDWNETMARNGL